MAITGFVQQSLAQEDRSLLSGLGGDDHMTGTETGSTLYGNGGADTLTGLGGNDTLIGGDALTGQAWSDLMFGGAGDDSINGGEGADRFYHLGIADHGSDWIQDYDAGEGDVLVFGDNTASIDDFQVNFTETANAGTAGVEEAFVIYRSTGQIVWAPIRTRSPCALMVWNTI